jgi:oxygen-independent coproporphyrinogen-3 oxidase
MSSNAMSSRSSHLASPPQDRSELPSIESIEPLLSRYDIPGPRYTSYPTAPVWSSEFGEAQLRAALAGVGAGELSVYVHIPFCESLCSYCACNREIRPDHRDAGPYLDCLEQEADRIADALGSQSRCAQLAVGGGTPTYLSAAQLERIADIVDARFPPAADAERSIEIDPRVTSLEQLEVLAQRGFNRISLGVQDLSPKVQRAIRRIQSREQTQLLAEQARSLGFSSVNFDLIYGLPYQTPDSFSETLASVLSMRPDRVALYSYAHVTWVSKQQRGFERKHLPNAREKVALLLLAIERMREAGYCFIGLDHFALPGDDLAQAAANGSLRRNFMGYTTRSGSGVLALGASGISELSGAYAQSARTSAEWSERIRAGQLATIRGWSLSKDDRRRRWLLQRLMCAGEIDPDAYEAEWGEPLRGHIPDLEARLAPFVADGLLEPVGSTWRLSLSGQIFLRPIAMTFDAYLEQAPAGPLFSKAL